MSKGPWKNKADGFGTKHGTVRVSGTEGEPELRRTSYQSHMQAVINGLIPVSTLGPVTKDKTKK